MNRTCSFMLLFVILMLCIPLSFLVGSNYVTHDHLQPFGLNFILTSLVCYSYVMYTTFIPCGF